MRFVVNWGIFSEMCPRLDDCGTQSYGWYYERRQSHPNPCDGTVRVVIVVMGTAIAAYPNVPRLSRGHGVVAAIVSHDARVARSSRRRQEEV